MPEIAVNIEIYCASCGQGICNYADAGKTRGRGEPIFTITPCPKCMEAEYDRGYSEGFEHGKEEAPDGTE